MGFWGRVGCVFGRHKRDGNRVGRQGSMLRSRCIHCGRTMTRYEGERWRIH